VFDLGGALAREGGEMPLLHELSSLFLQEGPAELAAIHKADYDKWGPVIRASGFKPGQ